MNCHLVRGQAGGSNKARRARLRSPNDPVRLTERHDRRGLAVGLTKEERDALRSVRWEAALDESLRQRGKSAQDLVSRPMKQEWKLALAEEIREGTGAVISWLAHHLHFGGADTLRGYLHARKHRRN